MKKILISVALCMGVFMLSAQTIVDAEYFFDSDPGFGMATAIAITTGSTIDEDVSVDISSLSNGFHMLYIRLKDSDGDWSLVQNRPIFKNGTNATNEIVAGEIFFDNDPGFGLATPFILTQGASIVEDAIVNISGLSNGFHLMYIRVQDSDGGWSLVQNRPIFKFGTSTMVTITEAEVFFDTDPGFGNGMPLNITTGLNIDEDVSVDISTLADGFHMMYIRVKDNDGFWSLVQNRPIFKFGTSAMVTITEAEVFFDADPGFGNGMPLNITTGLNIDEYVSVDISTLADGFHMMYIRVKDNDDFWSLVQNRPFFKSGNGANPNIIAYEYFVDNDPGYGSATTYNSFTPAQVQTSDFSIDLSAISIGDHYLYIRGAR